MRMKQSEILEAAQYVYHGEKYKHEIVKLTADKWPNLTVEEAYQIQNEVLKLREADGHTIYAPKMGLTSKAKWEQMGVDSPIVGYVFKDMLEENFTVKVSDYIHPKIEPEISFVMKNEISGYTGISFGDIKINGIGKTQKERIDQGDCRRAVHVIISIDKNLLSRDHGLVQAFNRLVHVLHQKRIIQVSQIRAEESTSLGKSTHTPLNEEFRKNRINPEFRS